MKGEYKGWKVYWEKEWELHGEGRDPKCVASDYLQVFIHQSKVYPISYTNYTLN
jgi:hypothetical protein